MINRELHGDRLSDHRKQEGTWAAFAYSAFLFLFLVIMTSLGLFGWRHFTHWALFMSFLFFFCLFLARWRQWVYMEMVLVRIFMVALFQLATSVVVFVRVITIADESVLNYYKDLYSDYSWAFFTGLFGISDFFEHYTPFIAILIFFLFEYDTLATILYDSYRAGTGSTTFYAGMEMVSLSLVYILPFGIYTLVFDPSEQYGTSIPLYYKYIIVLASGYAIFGIATALVLRGVATLDARLDYRPKLARSMYNMLPMTSDDHFAGTDASDKTQDEDENEDRGMVSALRPYCQ